VTFGVAPAVYAPVPPLIDPPEAFVDSDQVKPVPVPPLAVNVWLPRGGTFAVAGEMVTGASTVVAGEVVAAAESAVPVLAAVPFAVAVKVSVPAPDVVQLNPYPSVEPAPMVEAPGETAPQVAEAVPLTVATVGVTVTERADAPPAAAVLRTFPVNETTCPALTVPGGCAANVTARAAGAWIVVAGEVVAEAESAFPLLAAVPLTVATRARVPVVSGVQVNVYGSVVPALMADAPGLAAVQEAVAVPVMEGVTVTPFAAAPPEAAVLVTFTVRGRG
jgi:hypothetical protein